MNSYNPSLRPLIPAGTLPRLLRYLAPFAALLVFLFATITAEARFLFGNPPERLTWVMSHTPLPKGMTLIRTTGISMQPVIHEGDTLRVEPYTDQQLQTGDVVVFTRFDGVSVCHRVTAISRNAVRTSGDNNDRSDSWTAKSTIAYIVRSVERPSTVPRLVIP